MPHGRFYNFSDAQMVVAIASHRFRLLGLVDVCCGGHPLFYCTSLSGIISRSKASRVWPEYTSMLAQCER